jgi:lipid-A-disaccharide synthase
MKYFIIAGEQSGDLHGSNLVRGIRKADPEAVIKCWGGNLMQEAGAEVLMDYARLAIMGFVNVLMNIRTIARNLSLCKRQITDFRPAVVILIDYPGFNLRIAEFAKSQKIRVFYYISPKLWAWKESRVNKIKEYVDRMFIIFPFEVGFYRKHGINVEYYGNPLVDAIGDKMASMGDNNQLRNMLGLDERPVIALLAGSRRHEISHILPAMISTVKHFTQYQFVLACVGNVPEDFYRSIIGDAPVKTVIDKTYEVLKIAEAALVKSGTSTLEAALIGVPQVVCYKGDMLSFEIARRLVKVRYISLVNLIMEREIVKELIQYTLTETNLVKELQSIIRGGTTRERMLADYGSLKKILGDTGASSRIASEMVNSLKQPA